MLKYKYDSKSDIPEGLEKYYSERSGVYILQAEGVKTEEDVQKLETALSKERAQRRDAEKETKDLKERFGFLPDDFDADEFARLSDTSKGDVDERLRKQRETLNEQHKKELEKRDAVIAEKDGVVQKYVVDASLSKALVESKIAPNFIEDVTDLLKGKVKVEGTEVFLDERPLADGIKSFIESERGSKYLAADNSNGGGSNKTKANVNSNVKTATRAEFDTMDHSQRMTFSKEGGKVVEET